MKAVTFVRTCELGPAVLVHGGAGDVPAARREEHVEGCRSAAAAGHAVIAEGGSALDAAQAAARVLEDLPHFNAGTGAALTADGDVEHDAALMDGKSLRVGAVAALRSFKNPIDAARAVLEDGRHVLLVGEGAAAFARAAGIEPVDPASLVTARARLALEKVLTGGAPQGWAGGTIGAVAFDRHGSVAAATSTGGTVGKLRGRVGDSPIVGAGTLADDASCAVSATGDGEGILKVGLARVVALTIEGGGAPDDAVTAALERMLAKTGARGGLIVLRADGVAAIARTTTTMSWAIAGDRGEACGV